MSFSLPNFYFHATTAYDILRTNGVPLGKRDFMGRLKMKKLRGFGRRTRDEPRFGALFPRRSWISLGREAGFSAGRGRLPSKAVFQPALSR